MQTSGVRLGSVIGATFGLVFVLVNAGALPAGALWRVLGVVAFVAVVVTVVRSRAVAPEPDPGALRVYLLAVGAEVVAIPVGAGLLNAVDRPDLVLCWVVLVVGVHFLPFARAFRAPVFLGLGAALVVVALLGAVGVAAGAAHAPQWCAVAAGFVLMGGSAWGVLGARAPRIG